MSRNRRLVRDYTPDSRFATPTSNFNLRLAVSLRTGGKLALSAHDVAYTGLQRYFALLDAALAALALSEEEARWLVDRIGDVNYLPLGRPVGDSVAQMLAARIDDRATADEEEDAETACIDLSSLLIRVRQGGPAAEIALLDSAERYWMPEYEEMGSRLRLRVVGMLRAA